MGLSKLVFYQYTLLCPHIGKTFLWHPHASTHGAIPNPISSGPNLCQSPPFAGACGGILQGGCEPPGFEAKLRDQLIKELEHLEHCFRDDATSFFLSEVSLLTHVCNPERPLGLSIEIIRDP